MALVLGEDDEEAVVPVGTVISSPCAGLAATKKEIRTSVEKNFINTFVMHSSNPEDTLMQRMFLSENLSRKKLFVEQYFVMEF